MAHIFYKRIRLEGFNSMDFVHLYPKFLEFLLPNIREGKVVYVEDIAEGLGNFQPWLAILATTMLENKCLLYLMNKKHLFFCVH